DRNTPARVHRRQGTLRARVRNEPSTGLDSHSAHRVVTASVTTSRMIVNADYNSEHSGVRNVAKKNLSESGDSPRSRSRTTKPSAPKKTAPRQRVEPAETAADMSVVIVAAAASYSPTHDEIAKAAYLRYLNRGRGDGGDVDDWVEAER